MEISEKTFGKQSIDYATKLHSYASILHYQGKNVDAAKALKTSQTIERGVLEEEDPRIHLFDDFYDLNQRKKKVHAAKLDFFYKYKKVL